MESNTVQYACILRLSINHSITADVYEWILNGKTFQNKIVWEKITWVLTAAHTLQCALFWGEAKLNKYIFRVICYQSKRIKITFNLFTVCCKVNFIFIFISCFTRLEKIHARCNGKNLKESGGVRSITSVCVFTISICCHFNKWTLNSNW